MKTIQFRLVPDKELPMFSRLAWEVVGVSFREVLEQGLHPWVEDTSQTDLIDAFVERINREEHQPAGLRDHHILRNVDPGPWSSWSKRTRFDQMLDNVNKTVLLCDAGLSFASLTEIARRKLEEQWNSSLALTLASRLCPNFQELRRFLKEKDPEIKLSGRNDLSCYNWARILSLDDFAQHERALIDEAVDPLNFRSKEFLGGVTDAYGRLRLTDSIDHVTLTQPWTGTSRVPVLWQAQRKGNQWRLRPNVGAGIEARDVAKKFASGWRRDKGNLCFGVTTRDVIDMVESGAVNASFPGLRYTREQYSPGVMAQVAKGKVSIYLLGQFPLKAWSADRLKSILRQYGTSSTGTKKVLVEKLGELVEAEFYEHEALLDGFFAENCFVRVARDVQYGEQMPVLGREGTLNGLILHVYAMRHLRGNVVIDPSYENDSCGIAELASALISESVRLQGGFVRAN